MPDAGQNNRSLSERDELEIKKLKIEILQLEARAEQDKLEREKTELEVRDLKRPWYRKPGYVLAALPTALAIVGIIVGFYSGYFKDKIAGLQQEIATYEKQKSQLITDNDRSRVELGKLSDRIQLLNQDRDKATRDVEEITKDKNALQREQSALDRQIALLNTEQGLNQGDLQRMQAEYARLSNKRQELEAKISTLESTVSTADLKSLTDFWLGGATTPEDGSSLENDDARKQIVALFRARPMQQRQYISFYEDYLGQRGIAPNRYISVLSLLFEFTNDEKWKKELVRLTLAYSRTARTNRDISSSALGKIMECVWDLANKEPLNEINAAVMNELEKTNPDTTNAGLVARVVLARLLDDDIDSTKVAFVFPIGDLSIREPPATYFRIIRILRRLAGRFDPNALEILRILVPSAFAAVVAHAIQANEVSGTDKYFEYAKYSYTSKERDVFRNLEVPTSPSFEEWKIWAAKIKIKRLVDLWFEDQLQTLKSDLSLFNGIVKGKVD